MKTPKKKPGKKYIDLQLFAEEGTAGVVEIPADHVKITDPVTKKEIIVHKDVEKSIGHFISTTRGATQKEIEGKYKSEIAKRDEIISNTNLTLAEKEAALEKLNEAQLSNEDRLKKELDRSTKKLSDELGKTKQEKDAIASKLHQKIINSDIYTALSGFPVWDAEQTMALMKMTGNPQVKEIDGNEVTIFIAKIDGTERELSPREYAEIYLADPKHANQLKNNLIPGGATSSQGGRSDGRGGLIYSRKEMSSNPTLQKEYNEKLLKRENVRLVD
jgi:hypothetical protein